MRQPGCYLVGHLDLSQSPPTVYRAGIYSDRADCLTQWMSREFAFDIVAWSDGETFEEAREGLLAYLRENRRYEWLFKLPGGVT